MDGAALTTLTPRELEVLRSYASTWSIKETAVVLGLSPLTVRNHLATIRLKAGVTTTGDVLVVLGWLTVPPMG